MNLSRMFQYRWIATVLLLLVTGGQAQNYDPAQRLSAEQLQEDFALLRRALEATHPGLYRYAGKAETDALFERISDALDRPLTEREFYQQVAQLSSVIRCGHSGIRRSQAFYKDRNTRDKYLPLRLAFLNGQAYVRYNLSGNPELAPGRRILRLNGRAVSSLVEQMMPYIPGDGTIRSGRMRTLQNNFPILYHYLIAQPEKYELEVLNREGQVKKVILDPATLARSEEVAKERYPELSEPRPAPLGLELLSGLKAAVLSIGSFGGRAQDGQGNSYEDFLQQSFSRIREEGVTDLIVDLRGNGGGRDAYGAWLFSYLSDQDFRYYDHLGMVVQKVDFLEHTSLPEGFNDQIAQRTRVDEKGRRVAVGHPNLQLQKPKQPGFRGRVVFLIDGGSFSATAEFAAVAHYRSRGLFIGQESGGGYHGNTSGMSYRLTLPHSNLQISVPMIKYVSAVEGYPYPKRGIIPHYRVEPTIDDVLSGQDPVMDFALARIRQTRPQAQE